MRRSSGRGKGKLFIFVLLFLLIVWPSYQLYQVFGGSDHREDAGRMLYEVALFQMGLVQSSLTEVASMSNTGQLDAVKLAVYSANYTHDRLVLAYGKDKLKPLDAFNKMLEFITSAQIAGYRPLHAEEKQMLQEVKKLFGELYEAYAQLITSNGHVISSEAVIVSKANDSMMKVLEQQLKP
ncbi:hypothetical protein BVG16_06220 [Paenibacillus selenitireducens]|jgi:hypothetical protein|uniref:S-adenosylmethionine decarboxylase n=1 Tax=Paenibacillus selenitireducens TaxID=1324314 RepID=A0A1T2XKS6_9BACL|nr:hypothetical protein [Paenibacillus selenitireducens]OPA80326.1 hypothetical protein BVG16_06220 [Paenibacillus selenitireducens]